MALGRELVLRRVGRGRRRRPPAAPRHVDDHDGHRRAPRKASPPSSRSGPRRGPGPDVLHDDHQGPLASLTLDRPERRNALDLATLHELRDGIARAEDDPAVRVLILRGSAQHFCAGADLSGVEDDEFVRTLSVVLERPPRHSLPDDRRRGGRRPRGGHAAGGRVRPADRDRGRPVRDPGGQARPHGRPVDGAAHGRGVRSEHVPGDVPGRGRRHRAAGLRPGPRAAARVAGPGGGVGPPHRPRWPPSASPGTRPASTSPRTSRPT